MGLHMAAAEWQEALVATDIYFGGFCVVMLVISGIGWWQGEVGAVTIGVLFLYLLANAAVSQFSLVARNAHTSEAGRAVVGLIIAPLAYIVVDGPLAPWWPGFLIMALGGSVVLGLLTGRPRWGRIVVGYYVSLMLISALLFREDVNWYAWVLEAGVVAMTGLLFATIMSMLGQQFHKERVRSEELQNARDALFAEVEVAQEIQTLLLPADPELPDHDVVGRMIPADEVGGDYYDVVTVGGRHFLAIGDVAGHGVTAGLTMMMVRSSLLGVLEGQPRAGLSEVYQAVNRCIVRNLSRMGVNLHMTFNLLEYRGDGRFDAVGQHLPIMLYRSASKTVEEIETSGAWLGMVDDLPIDLLPATSFELGPGDLLVLYTDGIVEQLEADEMFGYDRLAEVIRDEAPGGAQSIIDATLRELGNFSAIKAEDDITMLVVHQRPAPDA
ncbi:MAG: SpoIIE family protein phosphatase [Myxococcota bacterium]